MTSIKKLIPAVASTMIVAVGCAVAGAVTETAWLLVLAACFAAIGLFLAAVVVIVVARSVIRMLRSTHNYARMSSQRTKGFSSVVSPSRSGNDDVALVLAMGAAADSAIRFAEASERGRLVVVTDRPDIVVVSARHVAVEFIQSSDDPSAGLALALDRLLRLAVEHSASSVVFWPAGAEESPRRLNLESPEIDVFGGHAVRALVQADARLRERLLEATEHERNVVNSITRQSDHVKRHISGYLDDIYHQGEALARLYTLLDPPKGLPPMRGWAVSPDLAVHLVESILSGQATNILETGSGTSTVLMALALDRVGVGHVTAIEHDPGHLEATRNLLAAYGVEHRATVLEAPISVVDIEGEMLRWYDVSSLSLPSEIDLLFVDGPPEATGPQARYPALPVVEALLADRAIIMMDDGRREAEQLAVERWSQRQGMSSATKLPVERAALVLRFDRSTAGPIEHSTR